MIKVNAKSAEKHFKFNVYLKFLYSMYMFLNLKKLVSVLCVHETCILLIFKGDLIRKYARELHQSKETIECICTQDKVTESNDRRK